MLLSFLLKNVALKMNDLRYHSLDPTKSSAESETLYLVELWTPVTTITGKWYARSKLLRGIPGRVESDHIVHIVWMSVTLSDPKTVWLTLIHNKDKVCQS